MKVLFTFGGIPHYLKPILSRLNKVDNLEIVVAIPKSSANTLGDSVMEDKSEIDFKVVYLKEKRAFYGNFYFQGLLNVLKKEKPDIIVFIWPYILNIITNIGLKKYIKRNGIKLILKEIPFDTPSYENVFDYYKSNYARQLNEDLVLKPVRGILFYLKHLILKEARRYYYGKLLDASVNYTDEAKVVGPSYGQKKDSIFVSTNSPDTDIIFDAANEIATKEPILPQNRFRIAHIGRLVKWKRVHLLIEAVSLLKKEIPEIELLIIGKGKEEENLKNLAKELNINDNVQFIGGVYENKELGRYLNASSVYVLAGMGGLSLNQAMAFGKPVICSIADGTEKRLVKEGYNGYYFENGNAVDLANKIKKLILDENKVKEFGENSLKIIKDEVNVYTVLKGYIDAFNYVTKNKYSLKLNESES